MPHLQLEQTSPEPANAQQSTAPSSSSSSSSSSSTTTTALSAATSRSTSSTSVSAATGPATASPLGVSASTKFNFDDYAAHSRDATITTTIAGDVARQKNIKSPSSSSPLSNTKLGDTDTQQRPLHSRFSPFGRHKQRKVDLHKPPVVKIHLDPDHRPVSVLSSVSDADSSPVSPNFQDFLDSTARLGSSHSGQKDTDRDLAKSQSSPAPTPAGVDSRWASPTIEQANPLPSANQPKTVNMHQTSSRLLRMTTDERPFTRDFKDLFSTLMVSLKLNQHRVRFSRIDHTFTSEEALSNLGSLKFSQSNRMPDPKDSSRIVTTTTTTTFSMATDMAKTVCARFLEARLVESLEGKQDFNSAKAVWQLTPKGMRVLTRFCTRNGIRQKHINEVLDSPRNCLNIVILERVPDTDKLIVDRHMIEVIFRRFAGDNPNIKSGLTATDTESIHENMTGQIGCRVIKSKKPLDKETPFQFSGKSAADWLMDCCMVVDRRETYEIAGLFLRHGLVVPLYDELGGEDFLPNKQAVYKFTEKGMKMAGWTGDKSATNTGNATPKVNYGRDSNNARTAAILADSSLRLLFREYLIETHCEENLTFWVDVQEFLEEYRRAKETVPASIDLVRETLATAYGLYNAFLAPGSPCELNIDHSLRNALAGRMTRAVSQEADMFTNLDEVAILFDQARTSVFKLMASDSVPKFSKDPKYAAVIRDRNLEYLLHQN